MCLHSIDSSVQRLLPSAMIAYKVVEVRWERPEGRYYAPLYQQGRSSAPLKGGWGASLIEGDFGIVTTQTCFGTPYPAGVHAYTDYKDALEVCAMPRRHSRDLPDNVAVVMVLLRGPLAVGEEYRREVVVYREMTILEEINHERDISVH